MAIRPNDRYNPNCIIEMVVNVDSQKVNQIIQELKDKTMPSNQNWNKTSTREIATEFTYYRVHSHMKDGERFMLPVGAMEDAHLRATINVYFRKLEACMGISNAALADLDPMSKKIMGSMVKQVTQEATDELPYLLAVLNAYMSEAVFIRGMVDLIPLYQQTVGRNKPLPFVLFNQESLKIAPSDDVIDV